MGYGEREDTNEPLNLEEVEARYYYGELFPEEMPDVVLKAVEAGHDGPALMELVWMRRLTMREVGDLFDRALGEMGRSPLPKDEAGLRIARTIAQKIVSGGIHPYEGALRIGGILSECPSLDVLSTFVALADEYEDHLENRPRYLEEIVARAEELVTGTRED